MKLILMVLAFAAGVVAQGADVLIPADARFSGDAVVSTSKGFQGEQLQIQKGTHNGVQFRFYHSDGSGSFEGGKGNGLDYRLDQAENWSVGCKKDPIDDSKYCMLSKGGLYVFNFSTSGFSVSVGGENYPGSDIAIRVDTHPAIIGNERAGFRGSTAEAILAAIRAGKQITVRHRDWPSGVNRDRTFDLYGFNEALEFITWATKQIK